MPNLITKFTQTISEAFKGPRTKDEEFNKKVDEYMNIEKAITNLKLCLKNYKAYSQGIKNLNIEIVKSFKIIYDGTEYGKLSSILTDMLEHVNNLYDQKIKNIDISSNKTDEWLNGFSEIKVMLDEREKLRLDYDHYDDKFEGIIKERDDRKKNGEIEDQKDFEKYQRVRVFQFRMKKS